MAEHIILVPGIRWKHRSQSLLRQVCPVGGPLGTGLGDGLWHVKITRVNLSYQSLGKKGNPQKLPCLERLPSFKNSPNNVKQLIGGNSKKPDIQDTLSVSLQHQHHAGSTVFFNTVKTF
ncbi:hypothetical protein CHS0354_003750 [Potamilus streckersoni]|uniref:Uncharacterized protein n=1 Tax=Potamilus streckersoni TaxID=2493646 RepID=A0AAE0VZK5_9BIVA|nr:hypothetical protein CHS0354_003750 [Potamilus streckersoni]